MLGFDLVRGVGVDGGKVVLAFDLHAVSSEEEQADIALVELALEPPERAVHLRVVAVGLLDHAEAAGLKLLGNVLRIVGRVLQFGHRLVGGIANDQG